MSELAFTQNGDSFEVPAVVSGWRVRRMKPRGAPELVYGRDGKPLVVPIECDMDELRVEVGTLGRYRLDPVDDNGKLIEGVPAAYVQVCKAEKGDVVAASTATQDDRDSILRDAMRMNTELAKSVIDRFPEMMAAAAELLRAADGAGLPARFPRLLAQGEAADDEEDDDVADAPPAFDLNALIAQVVPMLVMGVTSGKMKLPELGALFDWRKAVPAAPAKNPKRARREEAPSEKAEPAEPAEALPPLDASTMAHFVAIQSALTPEEGALAREVAAQLSPTELRAWFDELGKLSVEDAAAKIRSVVSKGGAS